MANKILCAELPAEISLCPPVHAIQWKLNWHFLLSPGYISISFLYKKKWQSFIFSREQKIKDAARDTFSSVP